ncbi:DUF3566 domain-containing protein [Actinotignum urinale]|uniref:DUF3566 domain-containing protein n=1 Tax=Actinotignum urinale TaxID=190146 RepID=A0ABU5G805_9ACTO|nr:DUF3566 domain-containing protein [Actinotignum urinale]MDY5128448.1 DUF3566 domain-containing protein [Actinotignum urinale]MDY5133224.1 DUF3566 domain-containing protein [Actinotignum urinale]MDY5151194.1 DUF3566 domain-containing protein [Actinotignum urinale]MDY5160526.1 DUF3566 domain-containing protein [Actinotignum urinale]
MNAKNSEKQDEKPIKDTALDKEAKKTSVVGNPQNKGGAENGDSKEKGVRRPHTLGPQGSGVSPARQTVGIRRIHMTISKVDTMSAMKIGFLISVALGIMIIVAMMLIWFILDGMHVFANLNELFENLSSVQLLQFAEYLKFGRWMSFSVLVGIIHVVLLTALSAICAVVYNLIASLVGGLKITVTDE